MICGCEYGLDITIVIFSTCELHHLSTSHGNYINYIISIYTLGALCVDQCQVQQNSVSSKAYLTAFADFGRKSTLHSSERKKGENL